jgi:hypothetical protein
MLIKIDKIFFRNDIFMLRGQFGLILWLNGLSLMALDLF